MLVWTRSLAKIQVVLILGAATLVVVVGWYKGFVTSLPLSIVCYGLLPILLWVVVLGRPLGRLGLRLGNWRRVWPGVALAVVFLGVAIWWAAGQPGWGFQSYYRLAPGSFLGRAQLFGGISVGSSLARALLFQVIYMLAWEFFFRGFLLFSLRGSLGDHGAVAVSSMLFTLAHLGKPPLEAYATFFGGLYLGYLCLEARSFLPAWLIHLAIMSEMLIFANFLH